MWCKENHICFLLCFKSLKKKKKTQYKKHKVAYHIHDDEKFTQIDTKEGVEKRREEYYNFL